MDIRPVFLFGEAEKGELCQPLLVRSLEELITYLGNPPTPESRGIDVAIQSLMLKFDVIFYRIREEGYSFDDYEKGAEHLKTTPLSAVALPGVGDPQILNLIAPICKKHNLLLLVQESDLYDYLTAS